MTSLLAAVCANPPYTTLHRAKLSLPLAKPSQNWQRNTAQEIMRSRHGGHQKWQREGLKMEEKTRGNRGEATYVGKFVVFALGGGHFAP